MSYLEWISYFHILKLAIIVGEYFVLGEYFKLILSNIATMGQQRLSELKWTKEKEEEFIRSVRFLFYLLFLK